ncbi:MULTISPECIES: pyocin knob domain-containing protein [unclassified Microcoleus]|uniref:pyocin knob domain-containing protein n=1 Tax=unclassified Microcoleus TaxID=2642155 RepID=UPI002FD2BC0F
MADYTFHSLSEPLKNNSTIQTILDVNALAAPAKSALAAYVASLGLPSAETQHLTWENVGVAVLIRSLALTYYLPSLGTQTPAADVKRTSTLRDRVTEMQKLQSGYPKCQMLIYGKTTPTSDWVWLNTEVIQNSGNQVNTLKLLPYINQMEDFAPGRGCAIGIQFIADLATGATLPQTGDRITAQGSVFVDVNPIGGELKKNDDVELLRQQVSTLQLAVEGRLVNLAANTFLGKGAVAGTVEAIPQSELVTSIQGKTGNVNLISTDLPLSNCFQLTDRSGIANAPFDANNWIILNAFGGVKWLDGGYTHLNVPISTGIIRQIDPLYGTPITGRYRFQEFLNGSRYFIRGENNNVWGAWREISTVVVP